MVTVSASEPALGPLYVSEFGRVLPEHDELHKAG